MVVECVMAEWAATVVESCLLGGGVRVEGREGGGGGGVKGSSGAEYFVIRREKKRGGGGGGGGGGGDEIITGCIEVNKHVALPRD